MHRWAYVIALPDQIEVIVRDVVVVVLDLAKGLEAGRATVSQT